MSFGLSSGKWEVEALRAEIKNAVAQDYYAVPPVGHQPSRRPMGVFNMIPNPFFGMRKKLLRASHTGSDAATHITGDANLGSNADNSIDGIAPNIIYGRKDVQKGKCRPALNEYRDALSIQALKENTALGFGATVKSWKSLDMHKNRATLIGITDTSIVLAVERDNKFELVKEVPLDTKPIAFDTFVHSNDSQNIQGYVIVGIAQNFIFFRVNADATDMDVAWSLQTHQNVTALYAYTINHSNMLAVLSAVGGTASTLVNIYSFRMDSREYFLNQQLRLNVETRAMAILDAGNERYMCFPQRDSVRVFAYKFKWFEHFVDIPAVNVQAIATFRMGGQSYLAIGGDAPRILRCINGRFHSQTILEKSWGRVEAFLAAEARTYRDDLILFVQHRIDFDSHAIVELDALIWNGEAFDTDLTTPCFVFGAENEDGLRCLLDSEHDAGISGATIIKTEAALRVLVPRFEVPPALFDIEFSLVPTFHEQHEDEMLNVFREVSALFDNEDDVGDDVMQLLSCTSKKTEFARQSLRVVNTIDLEMSDAAQTQITVASDQFTIEELKDFLMSLNETESLWNEERKPKQKRESDSIVHTVESLSAANLQVQTINGIPIADLALADDGAFRLNGTLVVSNVLNAEKVQRKGEQVSSSYRHEEEIVHVARLNIPGDLEVEVINGLPWRDLVRDIVFKNDPNPLWLDLQIDGVSWRGTILYLLFLFIDIRLIHVYSKELVAHEDIEVRLLNELKYPVDFLWNSGHMESPITGNKIFEGMLSAYWNR